MSIDKSMQEEELGESHLGWEGDIDISVSSDSGSLQEEVTTLEGGEDQTAELENILLATIRTLIDKKHISLQSWMTEDAESHAFAAADLHLNKEIAKRWAQLAIHCAREGLINELHYIFMHAPRELEVPFYIGVLESIPASVSPLLYKDLLPALHSESISASAVHELFVNFERKDVSEAVLRELRNEWSTVTGSGLASIEVSDLRPQLINVRKSNDFTKEGRLAEWYVRMAMRIDSLGYSYHAYVLLHLALAAVPPNTAGEIETKGDDNFTDNLQLLRELRQQLHYFCHLLYDSIIPSDTLFVDWLCGSIDDKIALIHHACTSGDGAARWGTQRCSYAEVLKSYLVPTMNTRNALVYSRHGGALLQHLVAMDAFCAASGTVQQKVVKHLHLARKDASNVTAIANTTTIGNDEDTWQQELALALSHSVSALDLNAFQRVAEVVEASKPTLAPAQRCLSSDAAVVELVVRTCYRYDDVHTGLDIMWQLIECTPAERLANTSHCAALSDELDNIQLALNTCELLQPYIAVPALSVLVPPVQADTRVSFRSSKGSQLTRFRYKQYLLNGCSFLFARISAVLGDVTDSTASASFDTSFEAVDRQITFGQAVVLKVCAEFGEKYSRAAKEGSMSFLVSHNWTELAKDLAEMCAVGVFKDEISIQWVGVLLLVCLLHYRAIEYRGVVKHLFEAQPTSNNAREAAALGIPHSPKADLGSLLVTKFELSAVHAQRSVLHQARELLNAVASCCETEAKADLKAAREFLKLIPEAYMSSETFSEQALHHLVRTLALVNLDLVPLQLRLLSPVDIARRILSERPDAFYTLVHEDATSDTSQSGVSRVAQLKARHLAGMNFIQTLLTIHSVREATRDPDEADDEEEEDWQHTEHILVLLVSAALAVGDLEQAYCYCNHLLDEDRFNSSSAALQEDILTATTLTMEALTSSEVSRKNGPLEAELRADLMCSIARTTSIEQFDRLQHLWRVTESVAPSALNSRAEGQAAGAIDNAKFLLYEVVAGKLKPNTVSNPIQAQSVLDQSASALVMHEVLGYLEQVQDSADALALLDGVLRDLKRKLAKVVELSANDSRANASVAPPDEKMIQQLMTKGFSRNGAKRSVLMTHSTGLNAALAWAIEHSLDQDFEHPIAQQVRGALLCDNTPGGVAFSLEDIHSTIELVQTVKQSYQLARGISVDVEDSTLLLNLPIGSSASVSAPLVSIAPPTPIRKKTSATTKDMAAAKAGKKASKVSLGAKRLTEREAAVDAISQNEFFFDEESEPQTVTEASQTKQSSSPLVTPLAEQGEFHTPREVTPEIKHTEAEAVGAITDGWSDEISFSEDEHEPHASVVVAEQRQDDKVEGWGDDVCFSDEDEGGDAMNRYDIISLQV